MHASQQGPISPPTSIRHGREVPPPHRVLVLAPVPRPVDAPYPDAPVVRAGRDRPWVTVRPRRARHLVLVAVQDAERLGRAVSLQRGSGFLNCTFEAEILKCTFYIPHVILSFAHRVCMHPTAMTVVYSSVFRYVGI
jgi:hypothetical protein